MNPLYYKLLENKLWYAKRRAILYRDGNRCTACGSKKELRVHHTFYYSPRVDPWMYPNDSLITLCRQCHEDYHLHHEIETRKLPKKKPVKVLKYKEPKIKIKKRRKPRNRSVEKIPKRILEKIKHGRYYTYKLTTNY